MFALTDVDDFSSVNLKCDPEEVVILIDRYECVQPGYHMNKKHWITVLIDGSISDKQLLDWLDNSYNLVFKGLSIKLKEKLK